MRRNLQISLLTVVLVLLSFVTFGQNKGAGNFNVINDGNGRSKIL